MRQLLLTLSAGFLFLFSHAQIPCSQSGNIIIFSNYDGGFLNINIDDNIPDLKIGIVSYEPTQVSISGTYAGNITGVRLVSYSPNDGGNFHCSPNINASTVSGVNPGLVTVVGPQTATLNDPNGYGIIICSYDCSNGNSGGCNTAQQIEHYFNNYFSGSYRKHFTQYGCWCGTYDISQSLGGNCCGNPVSSGNAPPTISPSSPTICTGGNVTLTASGYSSYSWSPPTGLSSTSGSTVVASPSTTTTYTVSANGSCGVATGQVTVTVSPSANVPLTITPAQDTICQGDSILLTASGSTAYTWAPGGSLSSTTGTSVYASPTNTTTYTVTNAAACSTGTGTATVVVAPPPILPLTVSPSLDTICIGESIQLLASGGYSNIQWSPSNTLNTSTGSTVIATPTNTTVYTASGSSFCGSSSSSATIAVLNPGIAFANFTQTANGLTVTFTNTSSNATSWYWDFGDGNTSTQQNPVHTYSAFGSYVVTLIVTNICNTDTSERPILLTNVGIEENGTETLIPVQYMGNTLNWIALPSGFKMETIQLTDMQGKIIWTQVSTSPSLVLPELNITNGLYVLSVQSGTGEVRTVKIQLKD